jgi:pyruvate dehydrogenase E1 component alpha subunit
MSNQAKSSTTLNRRTFLKLMGSAGATAAFVSTIGPVPLGTAHAAPPSAPSFIQTGVARDILAAAGAEKLETMYRRIVASRKWESKMKDLFVNGADGLYGAFHLYIGEEAVAVGTVGALQDNDYIASTHRGHGHLIAKGGDLNKMSAEIFFRQTGANNGFGGSMHIVEVDKGILGANGILSPQAYLVAGAGYGIKVKGTDQVAVAFFGDGSTNSMYYWSGIRNAVTYDLPVVFVIENNQYQITIPAVTNIPGGHASTYTKGLPISSVTVDGNDVAEVYAAVKDAADRARAGGGPSVVECMTYRWYDHSGFAGAKEGVDGAFGLPYRPDSELQMWMERDPIPRFRTFLVEKEFFSEDQLNQFDVEVQKAVDDSIEFARSSPKVIPEDGTLHVYAEGKVPSTQFLSLT